MRNHRKGYGFRALLAALVVGLMLAGSLTAFAAEKVLTIVTTSDFHGNLLPGQKDKATNRGMGGAAVVAGYIADLKGKNPNGVLLLDDGDSMQGPPISTVFKGESTMAFYNAMGYAAMAIGNHEFDWGIDIMKQRMTQAKFPFLSANIFYKADGKRPDWVKPYTIVKMNGIKVGLIGVSTLQTPTVTVPVNVQDLEFKDPAMVVSQLVPEVRKKGAQIIIVMAHMGGAQDQAGKITGEVADLANAIKGVDVIFGGHTHSSVSGTVNGIPVLIPSYNGRAIGVTSLTYDTWKRKVTRTEQKVVTTFADQVTPNAQAASIVDLYNKDLAPKMAEVLGTAAVDIVRNYDQESAMGNLVADIMREAGKVQIAFSNAGGFRDDIPAGPITLGKVWSVMPFDNTIVTMEMTGAQIIQVLQNKSKGMVASSGLRFTYDPAAPGDTRMILEVTLADGTPLDLNKVYTVATNNFMATGGDNYTSFTQGAKVVDTNILIRDAIVAWSKAQTAAGKEISPQVDGRSTAVSAAPAVSQ